MVLIAIGFVVSPTDGLITIGFVAVLHYVGFALSSKVIGKQIHSSFWLTLVALVVGDSLMGVTGIVLAPVMLHYIRVEASSNSCQNQTGMNEEGFGHLFIPSIRGGGQPRS